MGAVVGEHSKELLVWAVSAMLPYRRMPAFAFGSANTCTHVCMVGMVVLPYKVPPPPPDCKKDMNIDERGDGEEKG